MEVSVFSIAGATRAAALGLLAILCMSAAHAQDQPVDRTTDTERIWGFEQPNIAKIVQFSATEHAAILFGVDDSIGYSTNGIVRELHLLPGNSSCAYGHPSLSHDGRTIAYWSTQTPGQCDITLFDIPTGNSRLLLKGTVDQGALSWSWDDSEIAFPHSTFPASIQAVSVRDGSVRTLVPSTGIVIDGLTYDGLQIRFDESTRIQWSHTGNALLAGFTRCVPNRQPNSCDDTFRIAVANHGVLAPFAIGDSASISPVADRVAWMDMNDKVILAKLNGSDRRVLTSAPRWMGIVPDTIVGPITWSPDGKQLFFRDLVSENCSDDVFLLQVDTGVRRRFLHHSCIEILDWR